jgi:hypothetical protein
MNNSKIIKDFLSSLNQRTAQINQPASYMASLIEVTLNSLNLSSHDLEIIKRHTVCINHLIKQESTYHVEITDDTH